MAKFKSKAESSFDSKMTHAMETNDWTLIEELFKLLGQYFLLVEEVDRNALEVYYHSSSHSAVYLDSSELLWLNDWEDEDEVEIL